MRPCCLAGVVLAFVVGLFPSPLLAKDCQAARSRYAEAVAMATYERKASAYRQAISWCPGYAQAHNNLADALEHLGQYEAAVEAYQRALVLKPNLAVSYFGLGDTYVRMGLYTNAVEAYEAGLKLEPDDWRAHEGLQRARRGAPTVPATGLMDASTMIDTLRDDTIVTMGIRGVRESRIRFHNILFGFNSDRLRPEARTQLDEVVKALSSPELQGVTLRIEGHTDSVGTAAYNERLAYRRATAVKQYVESHASRLSVAIDLRGYGERRPIGDNDTAAGRQLNRRVEIIFVQPTAQ